MDRKTKKNEEADKKTDNKRKDRGDLKMANKNIDNRIRKDDTNDKITYPDGDSRKVSLNQRPEKIKLNVIMKFPPNDDIKPPTRNIESEKALPTRRFTDKELQNKAAIDLKKIRERYTMKLKSQGTPSSLVKKEDIRKGGSGKSDGKHAIVVEKKQDDVQTKDKSSNNSTVNQSTNNSDGKEKKESSTSRRKPFIRTIMTKNGSTRIYKAVTFVKQRRETTALQINIPNEACRKQKASKLTDTSSLKNKVTVSRVSVKDKPEVVRKRTQQKRDKKYRHVPSPDISVKGNSSSPPTEVARWAPSSINKHTKPYYEAWVNTTLAAISKNTKEDKFMHEKQAILQSFQRALERPDTPELIYSNFADERYMGRIKVTQK